MNKTLIKLKLFNRNISYKMMTVFERTRERIQQRLTEGMEVHLRFANQTMRMREI